MIKRLLAVLALALFGTVALTATPASADPSDRTCYTPHVAGFNTTEQCIWLPTIQ